MHGGKVKRKTSIVAVLLALLVGSGLSGCGMDSNSAKITESIAGVIVQSIFSSGGGSVSSGWSDTPNTGILNTDVNSVSRAKYTTLQGDGNDTATIMIYMCGTDLESRNGMGTNDLNEMLNATVGSNVNLIIYTGGCKNWRNNVVSSTNNQIYQIQNGQMILLNENAGQAAMTNPNTLQSFITWCAQNYPASRNMLIFWDHGGGSLSGYGYDEKNVSAGSMTLTKIDSALSNAGIQYDFIGFDACLMATAETGLMLSKYADYLIASEETEPGVGWYYTNWLTELSENTSISTLELGKKIADDFVDECARTCRGQETTLSVIDLAELGQTLESSLNEFAKNARTLIQSNNYQTVSAARSETREFASSSSIDQIDLVHFAKNLGTEEGAALADTILSAVKYNRTGNMTNAYGLSIYFPYKKVSKVDQAVNTCDQIGMGDEYSQCIREFATIETSGQAAFGGTASPFSALSGTSASASSEVSMTEIAQLLGTFLGGNVSLISGLSGLNSSFLTGRSLDETQIAEYIYNNHFDSSYLTWNDGKIIMPQEQWDLIQELDFNMFYDDGEGYIDLGLDNVYEFDESGNLLGETDGTWLSINEQPVAYYHLTTAEEGDSYTITGRVPALLNDERVNLILIFNDENPYGYIAGALPVYDEKETETIARGLTELQVGDTLDFLCDYYSYDGEYQDSYYLGEQMTVTEEMEISNTYVGDDIMALYRFTDIYDQHYWTNPIP